MTTSQNKLNVRTLIAGRIALQMAQSKHLLEKEPLGDKSLLSWVVSYLEADESERAYQAITHLFAMDGNFVIELEWNYGDLDKDEISFKPKVKLTIIGKGKSFDFDVTVNSGLSLVAFGEIKEVTKRAPWNLRME